MPVGLVLGRAWPRSEHRHVGPQCMGAARGAPSLSSDAAELSPRRQPPGPIGVSTPRPHNRNDFERTASASWACNRPHRIHQVTSRRSIESPHHNLWTDALHARELARGAINEWDRGTYVRWAITSAWTAFEITCETVLGCTGLGNRLKDNLNSALAQHGFNQPDWGYGLWHSVLHIYGLRKDYTHRGHSPGTTVRTRRRSRE